MVIYTDIEWEYAEYDGYFDSFRVVSATDESGNELAQHLEPDRRFTSLHELQDTLALILGLSSDDIILDGV